MVSRGRRWLCVSPTSPVTVASRVRELITDGTATTIEWAHLPVMADSICVHGDSPGALDLAHAVRAAITEARGVVRRCT